MVMAVTVGGEGGKGKGERGGEGLLVLLLLLLLLLLVVVVRRVAAALERVAAHVETLTRRGLERGERKRSKWMDGKGERERCAG
jgi:hypothetical protein